MLVPNLEAAGDGYVFTSERGIKITLSDTDVLVLAQSAQRMTDHVLAKHSRGEGAKSVHATRVVQVAVNIDLLQVHLHLGMIDPAGARMWFALPLDVASELAQHLPSRVAELEATRSAH